MYPTTNFITKQIAQAALATELDRNGYSPRSVMVVMSETTLVITIHETLTEEEKAVARNPTGICKTQVSYQQFQNTCELLKLEVRRITGVELKNDLAIVSEKNGMVVHAFSISPQTPLFLLADVEPAITDRGFTASSSSPME